MCGSSILNQKILITAAHCIEKPYVRFTVYAGHTENYLGDVYPVQAVKTHEKYNSHTVDHDIGLILVKKPIKLGKLAQRITVLRIPPRPMTAAVAGWGLIDEVNELNSKRLHHAELKVWTYEQCRKFISSLPKGFICAGSLDGKTYASQGDSGSALIVNDYIQIGVVSYKRPDLRSVVAFTDTSYYYRWIRTHSRRLYCNGT
ncbi:jg4408 [Pararge aegeria aegeria]|uniref:Jg4408 protein n=2 Tax=Pararge aegeria TaxID=116150 RepID=A0A8S4RJU6_9NEOP|nr:jg4408 [Pararge aegeria aegeria]